MKRKVVIECLFGVEVAITQMVSGSLGEIESVSPTAKKTRGLTI